jgi:hypothetical protein
MVRNQYTFSRPLTESEYLLLMTVIGWRRGSSVVYGDSTGVVGCVSHPDDVADFEKELRSRIRQKTARPLKVVRLSQVEAESEGPVARFSDRKSGPGCPQNPASDESASCSQRRDRNQ